MILQYYVTEKQGPLTHASTNIIYRVQPLKQVPSHVLGNPMSAYHKLAAYPIW